LGLDSSNCEPGAPSVLFLVVRVRELPRSIEESLKDSDSSSLAPAYKTADPFSTLDLCPELQIRFTGSEHEKQKA